jgi:vacuolar-type H+-ATPase subunit I/STV1
MILISFAHLKRKTVLKQWNNLESHYSIMTRIIKNVLSVSSSDVVNERLFSITNKIYDVHKSYHFVIIKVKMIIRQYDYKKNELKSLHDTQSNLKEKEERFKQKLQKKIDIRNEALQNELDSYINDVNESASTLTLIKYFRITDWREVIMLITRKRSRQKSACILRKTQQTSAICNCEEMIRDKNETTSLIYFFQ